MLYNEDEIDIEQLVFELSSFNGLVLEDILELIEQATNTSDLQNIQNRDKLELFINNIDLISEQNLKNLIETK